jgi:hypothetical protein
MEDVVRAIEAAYDYHDPGQIRQASQWLNTFSESSNAWEVSLGLLVPGRSFNVQFFVANLLLTKVRREWGVLPAQNRSAVSTALRCATAAGWLQQQLHALHIVRGPMHLGWTT